MQSFKVKLVSMFKKFSGQQYTSSQSHLLSLDSSSSASSVLSLPTPRTPSNRSAHVHHFSKEEIDSLNSMLDASHDPTTLNVRRRVSTGALTSHLSVLVLDDPRFVAQSRKAMGPQPNIEVVIPHSSISNSPPVPAQDLLVPASDSLPPITPPRLVQVDDFTPIRIVGEGASGKVFLVQDKLTGANLALKLVRQRQATSAHVLNEQRVLERISGNQEFISLEASFNDDKNFYLATTYHPGDLQSELRCRRKLPVSLAQHWAAELIVSIEKLHSLGVIHRDIKPANILISDEHHIVLADFGMAKMFPRSESTSVPPIDRVQYYTELVRDAKVRAIRPYQPYPDGSADDLTRSKFGTPAYIAPEVRVGRPYTYGVDFWSFGVVLYIVLTGRLPFGPQGEHFSLSFKPGEVDEHAESLLRSLLDIDPSARPNIDQIKSHPFFGSIDWDGIAKRGVDTPYVAPEISVPAPFQPKNIIISSGRPYSSPTDPRNPYSEFSFTSTGFQIKPPRPIPEPEATSMDPTSTVTSSKPLSKLRRFISGMLSLCARSAASWFAWR